MSNNNKKANGSGTIRKRADGRWEGRYSVGFDLMTGKLIQKSIYGKTQKEVRQKLSRIIAEIDDGTYTEPCSMLFGQWLDIWLNEYLMNVKESTAFIYESMAKNHLLPAFGSTRLDRITPHAIQHLYNTLAKGSADKAGLSAKSIKDIHGIMHLCMKQAVLLGYIRVNPADACVLPKKQNKQMHPLTDEEICGFMEQIKGNKYEYLYKVFIFTGLRESELLGLKWDCVDFERGALLIDKQLVRDRRKGGQYYFTTPKNGKSREIFPAEYVMDVLKLQKQRQNELRKEAEGAWAESGLVFTNELGRYISYRAVYDCFKRIVKGMGIGDVRIHDLRHTFAVNSLRAGDDIKTIQENLGHATAAFTLDVYGHCTSDMKKASSQRMERFIESRFCP